MANNEPEEMRRWGARRPDLCRRRLRFEKSKLGRGNTICPDTSSRSQSIAVLSRHQAGVRIEFPRPDIKLTFVGIRASTEWLDDCRKPARGRAERDTRTEYRYKE